MFPITITRTVLELPKGLGCSWRTLSPSPQECLDKAKRHLHIMRAYEAVTPKGHKWLHLVLRMAAQGNATAYHNFGDESANKTLKALCRNASQADFGSAPRGGNTLWV
jgi:hypothetical protein